MAGPVETPRIWLIAGPTASGKSALALRLAEHLGGELINADALQLYYDLRVLTARPSKEEEARAPHHLFGIADAIDTWSVGRWLTAAHAALEDIAARGRPAIVVGGTGLYFKALTEGLAAIPPVPQWVRSAVSDHYDELGEDSFRAALAVFDPASAERIAPGDRQRLMRAREVYDATGKTLSAWHDETAAALSPHDWRPAVLTPPREALYARCDARLVEMLDQGALEEVRALMAQGLGPLIPVMKAVGLRELASHLAKERTLEDAIAAARQETRRYAKRQLTWFRNQTPDWPHIEAEGHEAQWRQFLALNPSLTPSG